MDCLAFQSRYNSVKRFSRNVRKTAAEQFDRLGFLPSEAQVDYGEGALTLYPTSSRYRKPRFSHQPFGGESLLP